MSASCPRCGKQLEEAQVDTFAVRLCRDCKGMLLSHPNLVEILEAGWRAVSREAAQKLEFRAPEGWQKDTMIRCPDCGQTMEKYGYMGLAAIQIDRCDKCSLIWLDADELQNMALALAQSHYRSDEVVRQEWEQRLTLGAGVVPPQPDVEAGESGDIFSNGVDASLALIQLLRLLQVGLP